MGKLIVVSNRLPVTPVFSSKDSVEWTVSSGGLVSALKGLKREFEWIGYIEQHTDFDIAKELNKKYPQYHAISIDKTEYDDYYNGFANSILWPLFNYQYEKNIIFNEKYWLAYKRVNEKFARHIHSVANDDDLIWIHDYHLMLVPRMLSELNGRLRIGFFSHIPFPSSEIYRILPVRAELLEGVLGARVIGFHTFAYARHFKSSCSRVLGCSSIESSPTGVTFNNQFSTVSVNPIGIDPEPFLKTCKENAVQQKIQNFKEMYKNRTIILGIDRLDYTKGLVLKLQAYEKLLASLKQHENEVVLIQVGVPTREQVTCYQQLSQQVNQLVGQINSKYGTLEYTPIVYINKSVDFVTLCALYSVAQVLLVSSIRDGMNLVCFEYVACQEAIRGCGVTVISEFAGASSSLCGALLINPFDIDATVTTLKHALAMNEHERESRHRHNFNIVNKYTAEEWGKQFVESLAKVKQAVVGSGEELRTHYQVPPLLPLHLPSSTNISKDEQVLVFDYDAIKYMMRMKRKSSIFAEYNTTTATTTTTTTASTGGDTSSHLEEALFDQIIRLSQQYTTHVISRRDFKTLSSAFKNARSLGLVAEYGMFVKHPYQDNCIAHKNSQTIAHFIQSAVPLVQHVADRTPGTSMYQCETVLVFDYHLADPEFGEFQANELKIHLENMFANEPIEVCIASPKLLIMKPQFQSKTSVIRKLVQGKKTALAFIGDDVQLKEEEEEKGQEAAEAAAAATTITWCTSMKSQHLAQYHVPTVHYLLSFLQGLQ